MAKDCKQCGAYEHALAEVSYERDKALEEVAQLKAELAARPVEDRDSLMAVNARKSNLVYILTGKRL